MIDGDKTTPQHHLAQSDNADDYDDKMKVQHNEEQKKKCFLPPSPLSCFRYHDFTTLYSHARVCCWRCSTSVQQRARMRIKLTEGGKEGGINIFIVYVCDFNSRRHSHRRRRQSIHPIVLCQKQTDRQTGRQANGEKLTSFLLSSIFLHTTTTTTTTTQKEERFETTNKKKNKFFIGS